eukprot:scaffold6981_cov70-Phaeocystis_antarctica.AAC.2
MANPAATDGLTGPGMLGCVCDNWSPALPVVEVQAKARTRENVCQRVSPQLVKKAWLQKRSCWLSKLGRPHLPGAHSSVQHPTRLGVSGVRPDNVYVAGSCRPGRELTESGDVRVRLTNDGVARRHVVAKTDSGCMCRSRAARPPLLDGKVLAEKR